jgi:Autotransporter beta-domain
MKQHPVSSPAVAAQVILPTSLRTLALAMFFGLSGAEAYAQSYTLTEWIQPNPIPGSGPISATGALGNATATFTTQAYGANPGLVYPTNWTALLPGGSTIINSQAGGGSYSLGSFLNTAVTQSFTFSQSVINPVLLVNYVDGATYNFSGLTLISDPTLIGTTGNYNATTKVLTVAGNNGSNTGFRVELSGAYTSGSFTVTLTNPTQTPTADTFGIGIAVLTSLVPLVNVDDTVGSIRGLGADLSKVYGSQYGLAQFGLSYDCKLFDKNDLCFSSGARVTYSRADGSTYDGVALIAAYRAQPDVRLGAWIDQNASRQMSMNVTEGNSTPMLGAFAVWSENPTTGEGLEVKLSGAYGQKDLALTRPVFGTSEPGQGSSKLTTLVAEASVGYGMQLNARSRILPFAGLRYASLSNRGYTENAEILSPLTFAKTSQKATSVIAGVNLYDKPKGPIGLDLSVGVERYVSTSAAQISAMGIGNLSAVQMTPVLSKNRPFASASLRYEINKNEQLLFGLSHSKQFANSEWVNSATVRYVIGL